MLQYIIAGLTTGSVYALAAVGLVLTYKTSSVFNFGHGALATVSAYVFYSLHVQAGMPWVPAALICMLVVGPILGLLLELVLRRQASADLAVRIVSSIGLLLLVQAVISIVYGTIDTRRVSPFLPRYAFHLGGTVLTLDRVIVFAFGIVVTAVLYVMFRVARVGVATRAVVDDPDLLNLAGTNPVSVRRFAWVIGAVLAAASGLLLAPFITLEPTTFTFLVIAAFGAAAIGAFSNLPATYVGGLVIGVGSALCSKYFTTGPLTGLAPSLPFLVLFAVALVGSKRRLAERAPLRMSRTGSAHTPLRVRAALLAGLVFVLCLVPTFAGAHLIDYSRAVAITVLLLSLGLLVRTSGQVSLCHVSFMAIGVCAFAHLHNERGWPWLIALAAAGLITAPIGAILSIPSIRLSGLYLALATFGFGILLQYMFYGQSYMFGEYDLGVAIKPPVYTPLGLTGSDRSYYYFCLACAACVAVIVMVIGRSRLGRLLRALASSPVGLTTSGASINVTRVLVFCISAFLAAVAGVLEAGALGHAGSESYLPFTSLVYFTLVVISVGSMPWYAVIAAGGLLLIPSYATGESVSDWLLVVFGVTAMLYGMAPPHLVAPRWLRRLGGQRATSQRSEAKQPAPHLVVVDESQTTGAHLVEPGCLEAVNVRVQFGGLVAVDNVSITVPTGRITGLIGPNGAGKTTMFNACYGLNKPVAGTVRVDGVDISKKSPDSRARHGLGRTFQRMELFDDLTVLENVRLGAEARHAGLNPVTHLASTRATSRRVEECAAAALRRCGISQLAGERAGSLSTGQRRMLELARCLAGEPRFLLLDEPSSGLDHSETERFGQILQEIVAERGVGILLVEHDMSLVTSVCEHIVVLDFGKWIFEGTPEEVMSSPAVQSAYLGLDGVEHAEHGGDNIGSLDPLAESGAQA